MNVRAFAGEQGWCLLCGSPEWVFRGDPSGGGDLVVACEGCGERRPVVWGVEA